MRALGETRTELALTFKEASEWTKPDFSIMLGPPPFVQRLACAYHREALALGQASGGPVQ